MGKARNAGILIGLCESRQALRIAEIGAYCLQVAFARLT